MEVYEKERKKREGVGWVCVCVCVRAQRDPGSGKTCIKILEKVLKCFNTGRVNH